MNQSKRPNWLRQIFARWVDRAYQDILAINQVTSNNILSEDVLPEVSASSCIRFTIYPAEGGHVIQYYKEQSKNSPSTSYNSPSLVLVPRGEEIGKKVEHIIAMEALRS